MNFAILPNLVALTVLVAVFWAIYRKATTTRLHLWLAGWVLVLVHFAAQLFVQGQGFWSNVYDTVSLTALLLASVAFLISVSVPDNGEQPHLPLALIIALPALLYTVGAEWNVTSKLFYYSLVMVAILAPILVYRRLLLQQAFILPGLIAVASIVTTAWAIARGNADLGVPIILAALNFVIAILYWRRYPRASAGVLTSVGGFVLWGAVFPSGIVLDKLLPTANVETEVWNIPKYLVAVGMILTLLEDQIARTQYLAYHDELTGLPNRRLLEDRLEKALAFAGRTGNKVAIFQLDLNRFKEVNDTHGHRVGDLALQEVVTRLLGCIRCGDTLARSGGDEFTVVSDVKDLRGAEVLASALAAALASPIQIGAAQVHTGLSIGVALYPDDGSDPQKLHAAADRAMYTAKRASRPAQSVEA